MTTLVAVLRTWLARIKAALDFVAAVQAKESEPAGWSARHFSRPAGHHRR